MPYEPIEMLLNVSADPYSALRQYKKQTQRKIIGCFGMHIPEEVVHAAGMHPVVMWGTNEPITLAHSRMPPYFCGIARSVVDDALKGKLDFLDGMICTDLCLQARGVAFLLQRNPGASMVKFLYLPRNIGSKVENEYVVENLGRFKADLGAFAGIEITQEALARSIAVYNENRSLLRRLYDLRRRMPTLVRAKDMVAVVQASMLMPKEEHNELLKKLLQQLEAKRTTSAKRVKVVVSGHLCHAPRYDVLDLIEDAGGAVVDDDLFVGARYFANDIPADKDPILGLAGRYLQRTVPDPTMIDFEANWGNYLVELVRKSRAQGIIHLLVKYCPPHHENYPELSHTLNDAGVPQLMLQVEHEAVSLEQVKTRIQAFLEIAQKV